MESKDGECIFVWCLADDDQNVFNVVKEKLTIDERKIFQVGCGCEVESGKW